MQSSSAAGVLSSRVTLGCFEVRGRVYALDVSHVREVVRWQPVTPLPRAPRLIEGIIDLRGVVVPVVDLGRALGLGPVAAGPGARIAVAEFDSMLIGLAVDSAVDVLSVEVSALEEPPALASNAGYDAARSVVRRPGQAPIPVLSLESLLAGVYRSALPEAEGPA